MSTFKEWQQANLSSGELEVFNNICAQEAERLTQLGGSYDSNGELIFPSNEVKTQFETLQHPFFKKCWEQYKNSQ